MSLETLYQEIILDHSRNPRNFGHIEQPSIQVEHENPICGDQILLQVQIADDLIENIKFYGKGCAISMASTSMMTEKVKGKDLQEAQSLIDFFKLMVKENDDKHLEDLGELSALKGVRRLPVRIKCALLPWNALKECLENYKRERIEL